VGNPGFGFIATPWMNKAKIRFFTLPLKIFPGRGFSGTVLALPTGFVLA